MLRHHTPGFHLFQRDTMGKIQQIGHVTALDHVIGFIWRHCHFRGAWNILSEDINDRRDIERGWGRYKYIDRQWCIVVYDHNERIVSLDRLKEVINKAPQRRHIVFRRRRNGKKEVYGRLRYPRTFQELRESQVVDFDEPPVRAKRKKPSLPTCWDDQYTHVERSWKRQSKRRHQWKTK